MDKIKPTKTIEDIKAAKNPAEPIVCLTAYSAPMAKIMNDHVDLVLVGDSVGMVLYGMENTTGVTLDMMIRHGQAVRRGLNGPLLVVDMPYNTYEDSNAQALKNAREIMEQTGADAVKLEGGRTMAARIKTLTDHNIPVMAHIGLLPQSAEKEGGYKIKGRTDDELNRLIDDAKAVEEAGAFCFVLEGTAHSAAEKVSAAASIPSIGIGASPACDGQILVTEDMIGLSGGYLPKFVQLYNNMSDPIEAVIQNYANDVRARDFPRKDHLYS